MEPPHIGDEAPRDENGIPVLSRRLSVPMSWTFDWRCSQPAVCLRFVSWGYFRIILACRRWKKKKHPVSRLSREHGHGTKTNVPLLPFFSIVPNGVCLVRPLVTTYVQA